MLGAVIGGFVMLLGLYCATGAATRGPEYALVGIEGAFLIAAGAFIPLSTEMHDYFGAKNK